MGVCYFCHVSDELRRLLPICDTVECLIYCYIAKASYDTCYDEELRLVQ